MTFLLPPGIKGLKSAEITPIHKKEDTFDKDNYWPISILPLISKVFENILHSQVYSYIQQYLNPLLYWFRQGHGTQHALFRLLQVWQKELDDSGYTGTVLMDSSKTYDCLPHGLIIAKFETYGFDNISWKLFHSYFSNRKQSVQIGSAISEWTDILTGMLQGSILGPLIFNIFINDLIMFIEKLTFATLRMIILYTNLSRTCR